MTQETEKVPLIEQMQALTNQGKYGEAIKVFRKQEMVRISFLFLAGNVSFHAATDINVIPSATPDKRIEFLTEALDLYSEVIHSAHLLGAEGMTEGVEMEARALCNRAIVHKTLGQDSEATLDFTSALSLISPEHREELLRWDQMYNLSPQK